MTAAERALLVARVLEQHPHLAELVPLRLRAVEMVFPVWEPGVGLRVERQTLLPLDESRFRQRSDAVSP